MSAKDPRRAIMLRLPMELRPALRAARQGRRSASSADAMRVMLERALAQRVDQAPEFQPVAQGGQGRIIRLQLPRAIQRQIGDLARQHGCSDAAAILGLLAAMTMMPQDNGAEGSLRSAQVSS
ncbi:MAG: hypothetical protein OIF40_12110 [Mangrovicoccus sp.]|nr:hypothetical protein [Mangrovicoccus sp.]